MGIQDSWKYPTAFHIALKDAISKKLMKDLPALHCTCVFALYKEHNRILPKGEKDTPGVHPNGEDFVRQKHEQMTWLFADRPDCSCSLDSSGIMNNIAKEMGYKNVSTIRLKEAVKKG